MAAHDQSATFHARPIPRALGRTVRLDSLTAGLVIAATCFALGCEKNQQTSEEEQRAAATRAHEAQLEANEKIGDARRAAEKSANEAARTRSDVTVSFQKEVDVIDRKISQLKERAATATGAEKRNAAAAIAETDSRRSTLQADLQKLGTETGAGWDAAKGEVERSIKAVKAAVDSFETTVTEKPAR
jgi:hypothetical protein